MNKLTNKKHGLFSNELLTFHLKGARVFSIIKYTGLYKFIYRFIIQVYTSLYTGLYTGFIYRFIYRYLIFYCLPFYCLPFYCLISFHCACLSGATFLFIVTPIAS